MKPSNLFLKAAVILSSVVLVAGLVAYRVGAFDWFHGNGSTTMGGSKSRQVFEPGKSGAAEQPSADAAQPTPTIMSGSKSLPGLVPAKPATQSESAPSQAAPTIMPGPKAGAALPPQKPF